MTIPTVEVTARPGPEIWWLTVWYPHCQCGHLYGGGLLAEGPPMVGIRDALCDRTRYPSVPPKHRLVVKEIADAWETAR